MLGGRESLPHVRVSGFGDTHRARGVPEQAHGTVRQGPVVFTGGVAGGSLAGMPSIGLLSSNRSQCEQETVQPQDKLPEPKPLTPDDVLDPSEFDEEDDEEGSP